MIPLLLSTAITEIDPPSDLCGVGAASLLAAGIVGIPYAFTVVIYALARVLPAQYVGRLYNFAAVVLRVKDLPDMFHHNKLLGNKTVISQPESDRGEIKFWHRAC